MPFSNFGLEEKILRAIKKVGYTQPTLVQIAAIPKVMAGNDVIAIAQTGTGKTAAFVLPILNRLSEVAKGGKIPGTRVMILAPTRELAIQIVDNIESYGRHLAIRVAAIYGGVDEISQIKALRKGVHIVVATPGRLIDIIERHKIDLSAIQTLVLDEADRMLHMGFLPDIETIIETLPRRRQTLMFSATFPKEVESLAKRFQHQPKTVQIGKRSEAADTVDQSVYEVPPHLKSALLIELLKDPRFERVLVFVRMKDGANRLTDILKSARVNVAKLHSSRTQEQREKALQNFKDGKTQVLVATDIVARGIDIDGVTHVINYDFPVNPEDYIHRIGRTGRAEHAGEALSFVPKGDLNLLGMTELHIGQRLARKRLRGFDHFAKTPAKDANMQPAKKDWRKRTREMEAKKSAKNLPHKKPTGGRTTRSAPKKSASRRKKP
ncbi:DEAD/DEAH box helicase [Luteolibacter algae]|uniref:DEAD/DEAH box helicase n=1 Tax=Luteolibacter algae TaxID=454151 RepID=A0ABW5D4Z3_9BACT